MKNKPKNKKCKRCEKEFKVRNFAQKYCSKLCSVMDKPKKERKPLPKITQKKLNEYAVYQSNRRALISAQKKKAQFTYCQKCNKSCSIETHHIIFRSEAPNHPNLHHKSNLILLCGLCHRWFHEEKGRRLPWIRERELWKLFNHLNSEL